MIDISNMPIQSHSEQVLDHWESGRMALKEENIDKLKNIDNLNCKTPTLNNMHANIKFEGWIVERNFRNKRF